MNKSSLNYSIVIPTYNRFDELIITLPQIVDILDEFGEIIIVDQSTDGIPEQRLAEIEALCGEVNLRYYLAKIASLSYAINTGAALAKSDIVIILDDDIDIVAPIIDTHLQAYQDKEVVAVAGSYYASHKSFPWVPSHKNGVATSLASAHMSARRSTFSRYGAASWLAIPFSTIDWEMAEVFNRHGKVLFAEDCFVLHRAPLAGGCGNQGKRSVQWYRGTYHNHYLWHKSRPLIEKIRKLPKHVYTLLRYCLPTRDVLFSKEFVTTAIMGGIKDGKATWDKYQHQRPHDVIPYAKLRLLFESSPLYEYND